MCVYFSSFLPHLALCGTLSDFSGLSLQDRLVEQMYSALVFFFLFLLCAVPLRYSAVNHARLMNSCFSISKCHYLSLSESPLILLLSPAMLTLLAFSLCAS